MKALKVLSIILLATFSFTAANAQMHRHHFVRHHHHIIRHRR
jgi:hypothetical protein